MIDINERIKNVTKTLATLDKESSPVEKQSLKKYLDVYRLIKAKEMELKTAKNAKAYDDAAQVNMLRKMVKEREESAKIYEKNGRNDLASKEYAEVIVIKELLPAEISEEDIEKYVNEEFPEIRQKEMGFRIKCVKDKFPTADGAVIASIIKRHII